MTQTLATWPCYSLNLYSADIWLDCDKHTLIQTVSQAPAIVIDAKVKGHTYLYYQANFSFQLEE